MHKRWIFRYQHKFKQGDTLKVCNPVDGRAGRKGAKSSSEVQIDEGEKSHVNMKCCPYRKPTQVDRKRILRPTGEG